MSMCVCLCSLNNIPSDGKRSTVRSTGSESGTSLNCSINAVDFKTFKITWNEEVHKNRETWKAQAAKGINANILMCADYDVLQIISNACSCCSY